MYCIHAGRWSYGAMMCTETLTGGGSSKSIGSVVGTTSSRCGSSSRFLRQDLSVYWTVWPRIIKDEDKEESWYCHVKCFSIVFLVFFLSWNFMCLIKGSGEWDAVFAQGLEWEKLERRHEHQRQDLGMKAMIPNHLQCFTWKEIKVRR